MEWNNLLENTVTIYSYNGSYTQTMGNNGTMEKHDFRLLRTKATESTSKHSLLSTVNNRIDKQNKGVLKVIPQNHNLPQQQKRRTKD